MSDKYGGLVFPVPVAADPGSFPVQSAVGDILIGYVADFVRTIIQTYVEDAWRSIAPAYPVVKTIVLNDPGTSFNEEWLPALYVYRPGRETRETIEEFIQDADDYRFQKGRVVVEWIMPNAPQEHRLVRNNIIDAIRKEVDRAFLIGRDKNWIVPGDTDPLSAHYDAKAAVWGSSILGYSGAATIELQRATPAEFVVKMMPPAKNRTYETLKISLYTEELYQQDLDETGDPHTTLQAKFEQPDQGTGLGDTIYEEAIYDD